MGDLRGFQHGVEFREKLGNGQKREGFALKQVEKSEFAQLMAEVRGGSQEAAWKLITEHHAMIFRVVRKRLPRELRVAFDSQDLVQAAWASIFRHRSRLSRYDSPSKFVAFLATVAANRVALEARRRLKEQKRDVTRECPLDGAADECFSKDPTPSQVAIAKERWFDTMASQSPRNQEIIRLRYEGYSSPEIGERVGLDSGSVRRILRQAFRDAP